MTRLQVRHPQGASEVTELHAPRLDSLQGKTVALLSDDMWQSHRMLPLVRDELSRRYPGMQFINETELPMGSAAIDSEAAVEAVMARGADAVVVGNAA